MLYLLFGYKYIFMLMNFVGYLDLYVGVIWVVVYKDKSFVNGCV